MYLMACLTVSVSFFNFVSGQNPIPRPNPAQDRPYSSKTAIYEYTMMRVVFLSLVPRPGVRFRGCRVMLDPGQVSYVFREKQIRWFVR